MCFAKLDFRDLGNPRLYGLELAGLAHACPFAGNGRSGICDAFCFINPSFFAVSISALTDDTPILRRRAAVRGASVLTLSPSLPT